MSEFTDADLHNDYFLLEEVARSTDVAHRKLIQDLGQAVTNNAVGKKRKRLPKMSDCPNPDVPPDFLARYAPKIIHFYQQAKLNGVHLHLLNNGMSKRVANTSYCTRNKNQVHWRIEWKFKDITLHDDTVVDTAILKDIFNAHLVRAFVLL